MANIIKINNKRETEDNNTDPKMPPKIDSKDWTKTMEAVEDYLRQFCGVNDALLSYIARKELKTVHEVDTTSTSYPTLDEEMVACAPILESTASGALSYLDRNGPFFDTYITDRTMDWDKTAVILQDHK